MEINLFTGLLRGAHYHPSPNYNERPTDLDIDLLVIHNISLPPGEFGGAFVHDFFMNQLQINEHAYFKQIAGLRVSSHLFIRRNGEIHQFVPFSKRAWHAGKSSFQGRDECNDYSIGIELEGADHIPYTYFQYQQLASVSRILRQYYPKITLDRIVGHSDIAPVRKSDPGPAFDWKYYRELVSFGS